MGPNQTLLDLLLELQTLDRVPRMGYVLRGVPEPESVTEHSWHVVFLVWTLGQRISGLDLTRALGIALIHDLAEVRTGDLPRVANRYYETGSKGEAEKAVLGELLGPLAEGSTALHDEYRAAETPEARLVKACDKLQLMLKVAAYERWGALGLQEFWGNPDNFPDFGFEPVRELFDQLRAWRREHGPRLRDPGRSAGTGGDRDGDRCDEIDGDREGDGETHG